MVVMYYGYISVTFLVLLGRGLPTRRSNRAAPNRLQAGFT
jgi:hypothetical protein